MKSDKPVDQLPILLVGIPRSGTTWIGKVLSSAQDTAYVFEPDNEKLSPLAFACKEKLHRFPYLVAQDENEEYKKLWRLALAGWDAAWFINNFAGLLMRRKNFALEASTGEKTGYVYIDNTLHNVRSSIPYVVKKHSFIRMMLKLVLDDRLPRVGMRQRVIIKSVHAPLSVDWIARRFPVQVILALRNPFSLYASYRRMKMPDGFRNLLFQNTLQRDIHQYVPGVEKTLMPDSEDAMIYQIMLMYKILETQISANPEWSIISHDRLCVSPNQGFHGLFNKLRLDWSEKSKGRIDDLNDAGRGFVPRRVSIQQPTKWKSEVSASEQKSIEYWIDFFDLREFFNEYVTLD